MARSIPLEATSEAFWTRKFEMSASMNHQSIFMPSLTKIMEVRWKPLYLRDLTIWSWDLLQHISYIRLDLSSCHMMIYTILCHAFQISNNDKWFLLEVMRKTILRRFLKLVCSQKIQFKQSASESLFLSEN